MVIHRYTTEQRVFLKEYVPGHSHKEITKAFNTKFETCLKESQIKSYIHNHKLNTGRTGRFEKGHIPVNKGIKGKHYPGTERTWFKKGHIPKNYRPVGSERVNVDGYIEVKVENPRKWRPKHVVEWEKINGKVPQGHVLTFIDGNKSNCDIDNLKLISRNVLARMNQSGYSHLSGKLKETVINIFELDEVTKEIKLNARNKI